MVLAESGILPLPSQQPSAYRTTQIPQFWFIAPAHLSPLVPSHALTISRRLHPLAARVQAVRKMEEMLPWAPRPTVRGLRPERSHSKLMYITLIQ